VKGNQQRYAITREAKPSVRKKQEFRHCHKKPIRNRAFRKRGGRPARGEASRGGSECSNRISGTNFYIQCSIVTMGLSCFVFEIWPRDGGRRTDWSMIIGKITLEKFKSSFLSVHVLWSHTMWQSIKKLSYH